MTYFEGFEEFRVSVHSRVLNKQLTILGRKGGHNTKKAVLLLHGYPQTSHIWHKIAPKLAEKYTVIATDLRGYGQSSKPRGSESHEEYSKREMAADQVQVMEHFGFSEFHIIAHDRGARVAHRLALDYPERVKGMMLLDIAPTLYMYDNTDMAFAQGYWHWFFLIQQSPGPENMILAGPEQFWQAMAGRPSHKGVVWSHEDLKEYKERMFTDEGVHASCEDYRAAATIDLDHDRESREKGQKITIPKLVILWGGKGIIQNFNSGDVLGIWKDWSDSTTEIRGRKVDGGHYIPEERWEDVLQESEWLLKD
ncbi:uncharacterized protein I303_105608 [Kwoniella dejecticola CBS 10117]|uniref:AB hydrolase-1 domain-containing protein n=1 Tax=Kwoniella dejecticola CBS 10117 TaxID=1296121 RepID=A0A1A6A205_9TREE|nr:uncharacterized protein I303_04949 [Kwoniella dejecticola CBS 10117]OBR84092.1 hypothetical protein I303_04949 [Kwoniella dejecticola CBS 10117]